MTFPLNVTCPVNHGHTLQNPQEMMVLLHILSEQENINNVSLTFQMYRIFWCISLKISPKNRPRLTRWPHPTAEM